MIKAQLVLPNKKEITVLIRERHLRRIENKLNGLGFCDRFKLLFKQGKI
jgi:hypothetical protein